jgi:molybdenum cofactor synthesis domain-containing protein
MPDDAEMLGDTLKEAGSEYNLIITTGGTGIGSRDITVETVKPLLSKEIPGIMEFIRIRYGTEKPNALLSRGVAGITGNSLIFTLPGSARAAGEYMTEIVKTLHHAFLMQYGIDTHEKPQ